MRLDNRQTRVHKRVLVVVVGDYRVTGVITYLEERIPKLIDRCDCEVTLFVPGRIVAASRAKLLQDSGCKIIEGHVELDNQINRRIGLKRELSHLLKANDFDVLHVNTASRLVNLIALSEAKRAGIPVRIAHSHSVNTSLGFLSRLIEPYYRLRIGHLATVLLACSDDAGIFLCGKRSWSERGKVVPNGIDVESYAYSREVGLSVRAASSTNQNAHVYGYVGRLSASKNPLFLVRVFHEIAARDESAIFWVVGDGPLRSEAESLVSSLGDGGRFVFWGMRDDVPRILQGMDAFVFPSQFEGFGLVLLEAEAAGLPCFVSDGVSKNAYVEGCPVLTMSLEDPPEVWANRILDVPLTRNTDGASLVANAGYDISSSLRMLEKYYR